MCTTDINTLDSLDSERTNSRFPVLSLPASHSASQLLQRVFAKPSLVECSACTLRNFEQNYDFVFHKRFEVTCVSSTKDLLPEDRFVQICASKTHLRILPKWSKMLGSYLPKLIKTERFLLLKKIHRSYPIDMISFTLFHSLPWMVAGDLWLSRNYQNIFLIARCDSSCS